LVCTLVRLESWSVCGLACEPYKPGQVFLIRFFPVETFSPESERCGYPIPLIIFADSCWIEKEVRDQAAVSAAWVRILVLLGTIASDREFVLEARVDELSSNWIASPISRFKLSLLLLCSIYQQDCLSAIVVNLQLLLLLSDH
jgi:hypothetical protein